MVRALTKTRLSGEPYKRPPVVQANVEGATVLALAELRNRLKVTDRHDVDYLRSECLVHLVRNGRHSGDQRLINAVLPVLLARCEANLRVKVSDGVVPDAEDLRQEILQEFAGMFASDGTGDNPHELDYYECRFNSAFMTLRVDALRRAEILHQEIVDVALSENDDDDTETTDEAFARLSEAFRIQPTQEADIERARFFGALEALPPDERDAVILVHAMGYKVESNDPEEVTAATRCNCSGRTIRNRLKRAGISLARVKEDL